MELDRSETSGRQGPIPTKAALHRTITLNAATNAIRYVIYVGITFYLTPFVLGVLGQSFYGAWIIVLSFIGYAGLLEFGIQPAIVKLVAQHKAAGDLESLHETFVAAAIFFACIGCLVALAFLLILPGVAHRFFHDADHQAPRAVFAWLSVDMVFVFLMYVYSGVLYGLQLYHVKNAIDVGTLLVNALLTVLFLQRGGIVALAGIKAGCDLLQLLACAIVVKRVLPQIEWRRSRTRLQSFVRLVRFGGTVFVSSFMVRFWENAQPIIIGYALSAAWTTYFAIPKRLVDQAREVTWSLTTGFMPVFSDLDQRGNLDVMRSVYERYSRYILIVILPGVCFLFVFGRDFLALWVGSEVAERGGEVLHILVAAFLLQSMQPLFWRFYMGVGQLRTLVVTSAIVTLLGLTLTVLLVFPFGIVGVSLAVLAAAILRQAMYMYYSSRYLQVSVRRMFLYGESRPIGAAVLYTLALLWGRRVWGGSSYTTLALQLMVWFVVYVPAVWVFALNRTERTILLRFGRRGVSSSGAPSTSSVKGTPRES